MSNPPGRKPAVKKAITFDDLVATMPRKEEATFEVNMSRFFPNVEEETLFTFRKLGVSQIFGLEDIVRVIKNQKPDWSDKLCLEVAGMTVCHKSPDVKGGNRDMIPHFYCALFSNADDAELFALLQEFGEKAGADFLNKMAQKVEGAKKN